MFELFGPPFCISILKVLWTQILRHSLDFSPFCMNEEGFSQSLDILQIKEGGGPNFWGEPILQNVSIIWSPLLYFNFKSLLDPNSSSFIRFQWILYDSRVLVSGFSILYKLKSVDLICGWNQFFRMSELFGLPCCISILRVMWTQILHHSLDFSPFCMNQEDFPQSPEISTN